MNLREKKYNGISILEVYGDIEAIDMVEVRNRAEDLMDHDRYRIIIHFHHPQKIDYAGISILMVELKRARMHDGDVKLVGLNERVQYVLDKTGASRFLETYEDEDMAIMSFSRH